jgi:argininosuccinate lyase
LGKGIPTDKQIETIHCRQRQRIGFSLAKYDALGSIAHAKMLGSIGLLTSTETEELVAFKRNHR